MTPNPLIKISLLLILNFLIFYLLSALSNFGLDVPELFDFYPIISQSFTLYFLVYLKKSEPNDSNFIFSYLDYSLITNLYCCLTYLVFYVFLKWLNLFRVTNNFSFLVVVFYTVLLYSILFVGSVTNLINLWTEHADKIAEELHTDESSDSDSKSSHPSKSLKSRIKKPIKSLIKKPILKYALNNPDQVSKVPSKWTFRLGHRVIRKKTRKISLQDIFNYTSSIKQYFSDPFIYNSFSYSLNYGN